MSTAKIINENKNIQTKMKDMKDGEFAEILYYDSVGPPNFSGIIVKRHGNFISNIAGPEYWYSDSGCTLPIRILPKGTVIELTV